MRRCLSNRAYAARVTEAGQTVIRRNQGASPKTLDAIAELMATP